VTLVNPVPAFNFFVTMWDVQGPGLFGADAGSASGWGIASKVASGALSVASQLLLGAFSEVGGLTAEVEIESYQAGGENAAPKRFLKVGKYPNLTLKRGVSFNTDLWDWHQQVLHDKDPVTRKSGIVLLLERGQFAPGGANAAVDLVAGVTRPPVAAWYFERALPERLTGPALEAKTNSIAIESIELAHEGLTRVSIRASPGLVDAVAGISALVAAAAAGAAAVGVRAGLGDVDDDPKITRTPPGAPLPPGGGP
jgi:phage tail-like protein